MLVTKPVETQSRAEGRWPAVGSIGVALALYPPLLGSFSLCVRLAVVAISAGLLVPALAANPLDPDNQRGWSRPVAPALTGVLATANVVNLVSLVVRLTQPSADENEAQALLLSAAQVWSMNIIVFALIFWELDRGGSVTRTHTARSALPEAGFRFPQEEDSGALTEVAAGSSKRSGWTANFVDYYYFSLSNAVTFSPPDAVPLINRAKILVGFEAFGAFVFLLLVVARTGSLRG